MLMRTPGMLKKPMRSPSQCHSCYHFYRKENEDKEVSNEFLKSIAHSISIWVHKIYNSRKKELLMVRSPTNLGSRMHLVIGQDWQGIANGTAHTHLWTGSKSALESSTFPSYHNNSVLVLTTSLFSVKIPSRVLSGDIHLTGSFMLVSPFFQR